MTDMMQGFPFPSLLPSNGTPGPFPFGSLFGQKDPLKEVAAWLTENGFPLNGATTRPPDALLDALAFEWYALVDPEEGPSLAEVRDYLFNQIGWEDDDQ